MLDNSTIIVEATTPPTSLSICIFLITVFPLFEGKIVSSVIPITPFDA